MKANRLEAFTDGVIAIIITITVLELPVPRHADLASLRAEAPILLAYVLSFVNVGIYWNNHHHLLHATDRIDGSVLWANMFMLFWMSLAPWVIRWLDETSFAAMPTAAFGLVFGMTAIGYLWTQSRIIAVNGAQSAVGRAVGSDLKGKLSLAAYFSAMLLAFAAPWIAGLIYVGIAIAWLIPDRRIEHELTRS
ncbi:TMEM175 family protein [Sphingomonas crusticola]|uniref:TMEM175 family protein n=1 Tax=Sphingomonas crusticola TaxID=1697973 RepID=UPI000E24BE9F|nr:TMEM175 family protein [Sphingomonas crusticola]